MRLVSYIKQNRRLTRPPSTRRFSKAFDGGTKDWFDALDRPKAYMSSLQKALQPDRVDKGWRLVDALVRPFQTRPMTHSDLPLGGALMMSYWREQRLGPYHHLRYLFWFSFFRRVLHLNHVDILISFKRSYFIDGWLTSLYKLVELSLPYEIVDQALPPSFDIGLCHVHLLGDSNNMALQIFFHSLDASFVKANI